VKLVAYTRVSTEAQADGLGLSVQRSGIRAWAKANKHQVALWTTDEGISGSNGIDSRRGLLDALNAIEDHTAQGLVVYKLDRLARSLTVQEGTLAKVWGLGGSVFSVDLGEVPEDDPDDPMRTALRQIIGVFAQLERGMIAARMRSGRQRKAEDGGYAYGSPPFGWVALNGELVPDATEQATLARIMELRNAGESYRSIAATLTAEGKAPKGKTNRKGEAVAGVWHPETLRKIVERESAK
jgi:DNA invertase Pin-like site-specific DNA recombinase